MNPLVTLLNREPLNSMKFVKLFFREYKVKYYSDTSANFDVNLMRN